MKIVHVTTVDEGGAYKAVKRINECMNDMGWHSSILLRNKTHFENEGDVYLTSPFLTLYSKSKNFINLIFSTKNISKDLLGSDITHNKLIQEADIVCIHWINSFLSLNILDKLLKSKRNVIIYLHDTWFYTGGCHVTLNCTNYLKECVACPLLKSEKNKKLAYQNFQKKQEILKKYPVKIIGPGTHIVANAKKSPVFTNNEVVCIPNPINLAVFYPRNNEKEIRKRYQLPMNEKLILYGAAFNGIQNKDKGFGYLKEALKQMDDTYNLVIFGQADPELLKDIKQKYFLLGYIKDEKEMAEIYSMVDVYVTPSLQESFGYTILESLACGTPVVAFPNGGSEDLIVHKETGYLAEYRDVYSLALGINYCMNEKEHLAIKAVEYSRRYSYKVIGATYKDFFKVNEDGL